MSRKGLTPQREAFAVGLAKGLSQAAAYREAFPASMKWTAPTVWSHASELASNGDVRARVAQLREMATAAHDVSVERIVEELARLAFFDARKLFGVDGELLPLSDLDPATVAAVAGFEVREEKDSRGKVIGHVKKVKLAERGANVERLARLLGHFEKDNRQKAPDVAAAVREAMSRLFAPPGGAGPADEGSKS